MSSQSSSSGHGLSKAILVGLGIVGTVGTWGRFVAGGGLDIVNEAVGADEFTFPHQTEAQLLTSFTGIPPIDHVLRILVVFFWESVDGSHPKNSATGIYFGIQLMIIVVTLYLDGQRRGNGGSLTKPTVWSMIFQSVTIGVGSSPFSVLYVGSSPTVSQSITLDGLRSESLVQSTRTAGLLLPATLLTYALSFVLMGLPAPTVISSVFKQWALVCWNVFPVFTVAALVVGEPVLNVILPKKPSRRQQDQEQYQSHLSTIRWVGVATMYVGAMVHLAVAGVSVAAALFPAIFAKGYAETLHPLNLAVPPISIIQSSTAGDGAWDFLIWDQAAGYASMHVLFWLQVQNALRVVPPSSRSGVLGDFSWIKSTIVSLLLSALIGPGTAVMALSWYRDEILYGATAKSGSQAVKNKQR